MNAPDRLFGRVLGQTRAARQLSAMLAAGRIPSAVVFSGMEGTGKTLMALELAKLLLCRERAAGAAACGRCRDCASADQRSHPDIALVNAAYQAQLLDAEPAKQKTLRVDTIRHLRKDMEMRSLLGGWKIAVFEAAHTLEPESANALLKSLEEPLERMLWILVSSQRERLPKTVLSRCFSVPFAPLPRDVVRAILERAGVDGPRAARSAQLSEGSASRALELAGADFPESLSGGPLAAIEAADALPREGHLARARAENALFALAQDLRLRHLGGELDFSRIEGPLRELARLRQALRSNADARLVTTLAGLAAEDAAR
ncbi:MAG: hypothetical protein PHF00_06730 [Elusimicrobia bacterium]|nr:hypothetical protein [Elusimicrobiota bacterium]